MTKNASDLFKAVVPQPLEKDTQPVARESAVVQDAWVNAPNPKNKLAVKPGKKAIHELTQPSTNELERDPAPTPLEPTNADGLTTFGSASDTPPSDPDADLLGTLSIDTLHAAQGDSSLAAYSDFTSGNFGHSHLLAQAATEPTSPATSTKETPAAPAASSPFVSAASWAWFIPAALASVGAFKATSSTSDTVTRLRVVDGPVKDAKVYVDLDGDGVIDDGEPEVGFTDSTGFATVTLTAEQAKHALLAKGGTDTETNKAFAGVLAAPAGSTVINPLTTLVAAMMEGGQSLSQAKAAVVTALGLTGVSDLTSYDTFAQASTPEGMANHRMAVQIANIIVAGAALAASDSSAAAQTDAASRVIDALASKMANTSGAVTFDAAVLTDVLTRAVLTTAGATSHAASVAAAIASVNTLVAKASGPDALTQVAQAQVLAQVTLSNAIKSADSNGLATVIALQDSTTATQMASRIDAKSTDVVAPDQPALVLGTGVSDGATAAEATAPTGVVMVTTEDKANIQVTFTNGVNRVTQELLGTGATQAVVLSAEDLTTLGDGTITMSAVATDAAGNASAAGTSSFTLATGSTEASHDTEVPVAIFSAIKDANGDLLTAGPTTSTTLRLGGSNELGSTVKVYNGSAFLGLATVTGTDWSYSVTAGNGESYSLKIIETDLAGHVSAPKAYLAGAGDAVIDLGLSHGKLIAPVEVDGGKWFYHWDRNGNGDSSDDSIPRFELNSIFKYSSEGVAGAGTTDTYRYATFNGNLLALPTLGVPNEVLANWFQTKSEQQQIDPEWAHMVPPATAIGSLNPGVGDVTLNPVYNDLLAIWDAFNGKAETALAGDGDGLGSINGTPQGWGTGWAEYASASKDLTSLDRHYTLPLGGGWLESQWDGEDKDGYRNAFYVALEAFTPSIVIDTRGAPVMTGDATVSVSEGATGTVYTATATQAGSTLTYALGGADAALFNIDASTGAVSFLNAPDFEAPGDGGANNVYDITVTASNGVYTSLPKAVAITVGNVYEAPVMVTGASWATSFNEGALSSKLHIDVPEPSKASVVLDTTNQQLDFSAQGSRFLYEYYYRDDAPMVWADLPKVQVGQSWSVQTRVSINDGLAEPQQSAGIAFYDADGGVSNFNFSLTKWIPSTYSLSSVAGVATQSGSGNGISGEAYSLLAPETSDVYLKVQVTELGLTDHYQFFYKGLLAQDPWIAVGDARTYTSKGNDSRVGLFYKTNKVTAGVTFDDFAITVPVSVAENSTGTVYTANATADAASTLIYALSGTDSALFNINTNTGALTFKVAPDFEEPLDADGDNLYDLTVTASDGVASSMPQSVVIAVTNVVEGSAVNVTVAPAQVAEGDAGKLVFTFSRSSDLDGGLSVDIDVTGTAGNEDYSRPVQMQSQWTRLLGASRNSQGQPSAAVGADGAVYVSGRADSALMDGTNELSASGGGYVRKFDANGSLVWTRLTDAVNDNYPYSVTTDADGGVYVAGMAYNPAQSNYDGFVNKFAADGTLAWTRFVGTLEYDYIQSVSTDASGTVYVAGLTYSSQTGTYSTFLSKLESDGVVAWSRPFATGYSQAVSVSAAVDGSVYVTGYSQNAFVDEDENPLSNAGSYVSKYGADGNLEWTRLPDASGSSQTHSITTDADGAVYVAGYSYGSILNGDVSQGGQDGFVSKFDADGQLIWTRLVSGSGNDSVKSVFTGADGAIYLAGETNSSLNGQVIQGAADTTNGFVGKLDADDGTLAWTHLIGGSSNDLIKSVSADADGVVYIAGETYSSSLNGQSNQGNVAGFVSKILPAPLTQVTFAPGSATATLALKATSDTLIEGNETLTVTVKPGQAYTVGSSASATGTIEDKLESDGNSVNINSRTNGNISVDGETDLYSIQLTKGEKYVFTLEANSSELNAGLNLFTTRSASSESLLLTNDNAFYLNNNARITYTAQETGTYYLQANGGIETSGNYVLSVSDSDVPTPEVEFQIPSAVYLSEITGNWTTEISWRSQEFYLYLDTPWFNTESDILPTWENSDAPVKPTLIEVNGSGSVAELSANIQNWSNRPTITSSTLQELKPDTNYVYTIARDTIKNSDDLTNDYYESTIFHTSADIIGPVAIRGGVATGTHDVTYNNLTGFSSLDVATPGQTLSIPTSPEYLFVQFNEPVRWPAGGWNQEWSAAASNGVIDGVYLVENDVRVYEFGVAYIPAWSDYQVGNIHLDLESETGSDTSNNDETVWLSLRNGFKSGYDYVSEKYIDIPVGYTLKEDATYTLVFDVGMYDPMLNFSDPTTPPFEFSFIVASQVL
jgi:hypothetical protein